MKRAPMVGPPSEKICASAPLASIGWGQLGGRAAIASAAVVDAMHTAMNEVVIVWVVDLSAASVLTRAWSAAWRSPLDAPWLARPASPASSIFVPAATKAAELALMVPVVGTL